MAEQLKPCPFCGGTNTESRRCDYGTQAAGKPWLVGCRTCKAYFGVVPTEAKIQGYRTAKEAAEARWNRRAEGVASQ